MEKGKNESVLNRSNLDLANSEARERECVHDREIEKKGSVRVFVCERERSVTSLLWLKFS